MNDSPGLLTAEMGLAFAPDFALLSEATTAAGFILAEIDALHAPRAPYDHSKGNWASEIAHPCKRHLVHCRLDWKLRAPMDLRGEYRVEAGIDLEKKIQRWLLDCDMSMDNSQQYFRWPEYEIGGKIDGNLSISNRIMAQLPERFAREYKFGVPSEIKSIGPAFWDSAETIDDIREHKAWWIRKYPSQLNLYLFMQRKKVGFLILSTFGKQPRILPMLADFDLAESDLLKAEDVNRHVAAGTYPEPIPYDPKVCGMCGFTALCPVIKTLDPSWVEIKEADAPALYDYLELKEADSRFKEAHKALVGTEKEPGKYFGLNAIYGDIVIESGPRKMTTYPVPDEDKPKYKKQYTIKTTSIHRAE